MVVGNEHEREHERESFCRERFGHIEAAFVDHLNSLRTIDARVPAKSSIA